MYFCVNLSLIFLCIEPSVYYYCFGHCDFGMLCTAIFSWFLCWSKGQSTMVLLFAQNNFQPNSCNREYLVKNDILCIVQQMKKNSFHSFFFFRWSKTFCIKTFGRSVLEKRDKYNRSMNISIESPKENIDLLWKSLSTQHIFNKVIEIIEKFQIRSGFTYNLTHIHQKDRKKNPGTSFNGYNRLLSLICVSFHSH